MGCAAVIIAHMAAIVVLPVVGVTVGTVPGHPLIPALNGKQSVISSCVPRQGV